MPRASSTRRTDRPQGRTHPSDLVTTVRGNAFLVVGTAFFATLAMLGGWIPPRGSSVFRCGRWWSDLLLRASGVSVDPSYEVPLTEGGTYVYMANHQSLFDIPVLLATLPDRTVFMAKRELFFLPLFGWSLAIGGYVPVDRARRSSARESFRIATDRLHEDVSVAVFPEETRSPDGRLLPFQRGGFLIAMKSGAPIVPVGIEGTLEVQPRNRLRIRGRRVAVRYGAPLPTRGLRIADREKLVTRVRERIGELRGAEPSGRESASRMVE